MRTLGAILCTLLLSGFSAPRSGATVYQSNGSAAHVQALHNAALNGDTITLPAGTFTWSAGIALTKAITLRGAGTGSTIVRDAVQTGRLLYWDYRGTSNGAVRLTGITFQDGGRLNNPGQPGGLIHIDGSNTNGTTFRWDHCTMTNLNGPIVFNTAIGVFDHNVVNQSRAMTQFYYLDSYWNNDSFGHGDRSWAAPTNFGGSQFIFLEDNTIAGTGTMIGLTDSYSGARYVIRHNQLKNVRIPTHGTESSGRYRGVRAIEMYNNTWTATVAQSTNNMGLVRSGIMLFHDNTLSGYSPHGYGTAFIPLTCFRMIEPFVSWPGADGTSPWDVNRRPFYSGSGASNSVGIAGCGGCAKVTVANSPGWTTNQWAGYTIKRTSNVCNSTSIAYALIRSNTSNTITYHGNTGDPHSPPSLNFCAGDTFRIYKVDQALDQPGRARGSLVTGFRPVPPAGWNDQVTEPCYAWGNLDEHGAHVGFGTDERELIRVNEHFFNDTPMPGYTEYVYPHPLVSGAPPTDFNNDGKPDFVLYNPSTGQTVIWSMNNNVHVTGSYGATLPAGWSLVGVADFNNDGHPDYLLFNPSTGQTVIWYLSRTTFLAANHGPTLPSGWELVATDDFNDDGKPDLVLYNPSTRQTVVWYMNNNVHVTGSYGATIPADWSLAAVADFNGDGHPDYLLFNANTGDSVIWYLSGTTHTSGRYGSTIAAGYTLAGTADFNGDGKPDYVLYNPSTHQTAIWYMNNYLLIGTADGPTLPSGWSLVAP